MKKVIINQNRINSSRHPIKHMIKVNNKPIIQFLFSRLKKVKNKDKIILATTKTSKDDALVRLAKKIILVYLEEVKTMLCKEFYMQQKNLKLI